MMSEPLSGVERRADRAREFRLSPLDRVRVVLNLERRRPMAQSVAHRDDD